MLKVVVNGVISESQLTFVKGRQILDDIVIIANKVVDDDKKRKKKPIMFKVDCKKKHMTWWN